MKKMLIFIFLLIGTFFSLNVEVKADNLIKDAKSGFLIEANTGAILYNYNEKKRLPMASMTKIMSLYLIFEAMGKGLFSLNDTHQASSTAATKTGSHIYLAVGEVMKVEDYIKSICIVSANDATVALAEKVAGTEEAFVKMMNNKAKEFGLTDTKFSDSTGLASTDHYSTAYDMAIMAMHLVNDYPLVLNYSKRYEDYIRTETTNPFWLVNTNKLVRFYEGVDGLKTGWTDEAGYCLTATIKVDNLRLIGVLMGGSTADERNAEMRKLLNYGINTYKNETIIKKDDFVTHIYDLKTYPNEYDLRSSKDVYITKKRNETLKEIKKDIVKKEDGFYLKITYDNNEYELIYLKPGSDVKNANIKDVLLSLIKLFFKTK